MPGHNQPHAVGRAQKNSVRGAKDFLAKQKEAGQKFGCKEVGLQELKKKMSHPRKKIALSCSSKMARLAWITYRVCRVCATEIPGHRGRAKSTFIIWPVHNPAIDGIGLLRSLQQTNKRERNWVP